MSFAMRLPAQVEVSSDRVLDKSDPRWARLHQIIDERSLMRGDFTLSSGRKSNFLFQLRQTTMFPEGQFLLGDIIVDYMKSRGLTSVGGLELGAVPVVSVVGVASHLKHYDLHPFFVRKEAKKHGAKERIDGDLPNNSEALIIDDVTTTGGSILKAVEAIRDEKNCRVNVALSIVDREEGATEAMAENGIELVSIFKKSDFKI